MRIADICTRCVVHIGANKSVQEAAELMRKQHVGALVVVDKPTCERVPVGILTDRDIVLSVVAPGIEAAVLTVADVMTHPVAVCSENQNLLDAILVMSERGVRRLPVVDAHGSLAGMVTFDDIYGALGIQMHELCRALTREQVREMQLRV